MAKSIYNLGITSIVFNSVAAFLSLFGCILSFSDYSGIDSTHYYYDYYADYGYDTIKNYETGILPFFGLLFAALALLFIILSFKKKWKFSIGTIVTLIVSQLFLYVSILVGQYSYYSIVGYIINCVAGALMFIELILVIIYTAYCTSSAVMMPIANQNYTRNAQVSSIPENTPNFVNNYNNMRLVLKLNELYQSGVITKEEYEAKKDSLLGF